MIYTPQQTSAGPEQLLHEDAQVRIRAAVRKLSSEPGLSSVLIEEQVLDSLKPTNFRFIRHYRSVASRAGFAIAETVRQHRQGYRHSVLLARSEAADPPAPTTTSGAQKLAFGSVGRGRVRSAELVALI